MNKKEVEKELLEKVSWALRDIYREHDYHFKYFSNEVDFSSSMMVNIKDKLKRNI